jgi:hypothetical protein
MFAFRNYRCFVFGYMPEEVISVPSGHRRGFSDMIDSFVPSTHAGVPILTDE